MSTPVYVGQTEGKVVISYRTQGGDTYDFPAEPFSEIDLLRDPESVLGAIVKHLDNVGIDKPEFLLPKKGMIPQLKALLEEHQTLLEKMWKERIDPQPATA